MTTAAVRHYFPGQLQNRKGVSVAAAASGVVDAKTSRPYDHCRNDHQQQHHDHEEDNDDGGGDDSDDDDGRSSAVPTIRMSPTSSSSRPRPAKRTDDSSSSFNRKNGSMSDRHPRGERHQRLVLTDKLQLPYDCRRRSPAFVLLSFLCLLVVVHLGWSVLAGIHHHLIIAMDFPRITILTDRGSPSVPPDEDIPHPLSPLLLQPPPPPLRMAAHVVVRRRIRGGDGGHKNLSGWFPGTDDSARWSNGKIVDRLVQVAEYEVLATPWTKRKQRPPADISTTTMKTRTNAADDSAHRGSGKSPDGNNNVDATTTATTPLLFLGYLRITKTASTATLDFLNNNDHDPISSSSSPSLLTYDHFLDYPEYFQRISGGSIYTTRANIPACVFGRRQDPHDYPHVPPEDYRPSPPPPPPQQQTEEEKRKNDTGATILPDYAWQCPHTTYRNIVATWARGLPYLRSNKDERESEEKIAKEEGKEQQEEEAFAALHLFTLVREPTERFVSFFHYWRNIYPHWKGLATPEEHDRMLDGDLIGFLKLQSQILRPMTVNSAFQYLYLSDSLSEAISMVRDSPVRVVALVHECFDVSLRLLADLFPDLLDPEDVKTYLARQGNGTSQRVASAARFPPPSELVRPVQPYRLDEVRNQSEGWLTGDYLFYRAAVEQFRRWLEASRLDLSEPSVRDCYRRLKSS